MRVEAFDFELPEELIALRPARPRRNAKLLVSDGKSVRHSRMAEIGDWLRPGDLLIFNDTKVLPARLLGVKIGHRSRQAGHIDVTLFSVRDARTWDARVKSEVPSAPGDTIDFGQGLQAQIVRTLDGNKCRLRFNRSGEELIRAIERTGQLKLPPYIMKHRLPDADDARDYQTIFAEKPGSLAAPSASLPFDQPLVARLAELKVEICFVTLHVGAATFQQIAVESTEDHRMHPEWGCVPKKTAERILAARLDGRRVIPVGTTSLRLVETAAQQGLRAWEGGTDLFITPGYKFLVCDGLVTNFHLPKSTLFMLVSALIGLDQALALYAAAIKSNYRFLSYGDSCLLLPKGIKPQPVLKETQP